MRNPAIVSNPGIAGVGLIHALSLGGVPIPASIKFVAGDEPDLAGLRLPYIIKPSSRTEAVGGRAFRLQVVEDRAGLEASVAELARDPLLTTLHAAAVLAVRLAGRQMFS